jgi:hypothetical protein
MGIDASQIKPEFANHQSRANKEPIIMNKKQGRSLSRRRTIVIFLIVVLVIAGGFFLLGPDDEVKAPSLEYPKGVSREEQVAYIMQEHIVHQGGQPVHSFVLYAENRPEGIVIHKGVGTIGSSDTPIDQEYQYKVGSSTKTVVATVILQLMEEGELDLDDPASKYLGEIGYLRFDEIHVLDGESHADEITIDHLLQHRTGLGDIFTDTAVRFFIDVFLNPNRQYSPETIMDKFFAYKLNEKPHFKPGEGYYYSDTNYVLLGLIIEHITGDSLSDQIRQRVLEPLEMHDTYFEFYESETGSGKRLNSYEGRLNMTKHFSTSLSVNRVETPAFQAGRFQHHNGGSDTRLMLCHECSSAMLSGMHLGLFSPLLGRQELSMNAAKTSRRRTSGDFQSHSKLPALAGSS